MRRLPSLAATPFLALAAPAVAQDMDHGAMPGMAMPAPAPDAACSPEHAAMGHCAAHGEPAPPPGEAAGDTPPPAPVAADYADRIWGRAAMAPARARLKREHGGMTLSQVTLNLAELRARAGETAYAWDAEAWFGGDVHRLTVKSAGSGAFGGRLDRAEVQALYSRAVGPYFNLQAGLRQDLGPRPARTYAVLGFEGLAPYWFEVEGAVFLSDKGQVLARLEGSYDQRITQRLILQPRAEVNLSAQAMPAEGLGAGLVDAELGLRLRYELKRELAPYVGLAWERKFGATARYARQAGEDTGGLSFVAGLRLWF